MTTEGAFGLARASAADHLFTDAPSIGGGERAEKSQDEPLPGH
jgi:hypothetical protein